MKTGSMDIRCYPDRVLRRTCSPIRRIDDDVVRRARRMLEQMYESEGVGLAGPQIGWTDQIITLDPELEGDGTRVFINPRIVERDGGMELEEGCLSLPGMKLTVPRSERVKVVAYTLSGERVEITAEGFAACVWQHELDHLHGLLIIDKVSPTALLSVRDQLKELEREE